MKKTTVCLLALTLAGLVVTIEIASAFFGAGFVDEEHRLGIKQAIEENDFKAWKTAIIETLTQENFNKLVERHKAISERRKLQDVVRQAIEEGDYEAYKEAVENLMGSYKVMSEEDFNAMIEHYKTRELGGGFGHIGRSGCLGIGFGRHYMHW